MAASMQSRKMSDKHIAALNELEKGLGAPDASLNAQAQVTTRASMLDNGVGTLTFYQYKDWSGSVLGSYPPTILKDEERKFSHRGVPPKDPKGSKGAVIYVGPNVQGGTDDCAWVLAWNTPGDGTPNKIYVETGLKTQYPETGIDWNAIQSNLDSLGDTTSHYHDPNTGAEASARIGAGNMPTAPAVFDVSP